MRNRIIERKRGINHSEYIHRDKSGNEWLVEKRWTKLEKGVIVV